MNDISNWKLKLLNADIIDNNTAILVTYLAATDPGLWTWALSFAKCDSPSVLPYISLLLHY